MGAYSLQHRDNAEKGGPLEASDESVISGARGSVCRKPGQQPCLGKGQHGPIPTKHAIPSSSGHSAESVSGKPHQSPQPVT